MSINIRLPAIVSGVEVRSTLHIIIAILCHQLTQQLLSLHPIVVTHFTFISAHSLRNNRLPQEAFSAAFCLE